MKLDADEKDILQSVERGGELQADWEKTRITPSALQPSGSGPLAHYEFDGSLQDASGKYQRGRGARG